MVSPNLISYKKVTAFLGRGAVTFLIDLYMLSESLQRYSVSLFFKIWRIKISVQKQFMMYITLDLYTHVTDDKAKSEMDKLQNLYQEII